MAKQRYLSYESAKSFIHTLNLKTSTEYRRWARSLDKPDDIPIIPEEVYKKGNFWLGWKDWLGESYERTAANKKDVIGKRFEKLIPLEQVGISGSHLVYKCICDCGNYTEVNTCNLNRTKSCGCHRRESCRNIQYTHGRAYSNIYNIWGNMIARCTNPKHKSYSTYGGKGITICERWLTFENFFEDMGERPKNMSIDRINTNGNYEPSNCKWSTTTEQARNTNSNLLITFNNKTQCVASWAEEVGLGYGCLYQRIKAGWDIERALITPNLQTN